MSLIEKVESLEDEILELESLLENKKKELGRLLRGAYSPCLKKIERYSPVFDKRFDYCLKELYKLNDSSIKKISSDSKYMFIKLNSFWDTISIESEYSKKDFVKDLKERGFIENSSRDYYKSVKIGSKCIKALCVDLNKIVSMCEEA